MSSSTRRVMVLPRDRNPYQDLLYAGVAPYGFEPVYVGERTRSRTLNLALLPFELVAGRLRGRRLLHVHWLYGFAVPVIGGMRAVRRLCLWWFRLFLFTARVAGVHVVWTVHNVLPHEQVFPDDVLARRLLVAHCSLVVAHSHEALSEIRERFGAPRAAIVCPIGPYALPDGEHERNSAGDHRCQVAFVGTITPHKRVEDLLDAFRDDELRRHARLTIAGRCDDGALANDLRRRAAAVDADARFEHLSERDLAQLLAGTDLVALPVRGASTSSTVVLALTAGVPVVLPDDAVLQPLPAGAVVRYDGTVRGLRDAIAGVAQLGAAARTEMAAAARRWAAASPSWREIGADLARAYAELVDPRPRPSITESPVP